MKNVLFGFKQSIACNYNLGFDELILAKWFYLTTLRSDRDSLVINNSLYYCVSYAEILEEFPILNCNIRSVANKFKKLEDAKVLNRKTVRTGGTFSYFSLGENFSKIFEGI